MAPLRAVCAFARPSSTCVRAFAGAVCPCLSAWAIVWTPAFALSRPSCAVDTVALLIYIRLTGICELIGGTYLILVEFVSLPTFFEAMARFFTTCPRSKLHCRSPTWRAFRAGAAYTAPELRLRTTRETTRRVENKEVNIGT